jgi:hypothetical protein
MQIRLCSVIFDGPDSTSNPDEREMKRSTLQELVEFHESDPKVFCNARISEDTIAMVGLVAVLVCLSVCLSVCMPACLHACLPVCLFVCLYVRLPACLFVCLSVRSGGVCVSKEGDAIGAVFLYASLLTLIHPMLCLSDSNEPVPITAQAGREGERPRGGRAAVYGPAVDSSGAGVRAAASRGTRLLQLRLLL